MAASVLVSRAYFPPQVGGISYLMAEICAHLAPDAVSVLTAVAGAATGGDGPTGVRVYRRPRTFEDTSVLHRFWMTLAFAELALRERPRLLQFATIEDADTAWWAHRLLRLPYVIYAHGNEILSAIGNRWDRPRQVLRSAARVIANSRYTADLVAQTGVDRTRIEVVHPGCDVERFQPRPVDQETRNAILGRHAGRRIVLTVGNLVERKGHDVAIRAMQRIASRVPDACYLIAGDGPQRPALEAMVQELGIADRVLFAGRISDRQLPLYYNLCDVFLMPSRARLEQNDVEGFGIVFLEAGACGKASIGGRSGGVTEAIVDGRTGLLVEPGDPDSVGVALSALLGAPDYADRLGKQAREHVVAEHSWSRTGERIAGILARVA
jgi:phosphatidylinositol alpha-1,6-mannosyltransferase